LSIFPFSIAEPHSGQIGLKFFVWPDEGAKNLNPSLALWIWPDSGDIDPQSEVKKIANSKF
jgi:hypothetical protein